MRRAVRSSTSVPTSRRRPLRRASGRRAVVLVAAAALLVPALAASAGSIATTRLFGATRFDTAAAVAEAAWPGTADEVFIATGSNYADALVAGSVAADRGPVLLVTRDGVPAVTADALQRLRPEQAWILGGTAVVSDATMAQVAANLPAGASTQRLSGSNRHGTAAAIAGEFHAGPVAMLYLVNGRSFTDGIAAAAAAGATGAPVLTTDPGELPAATRAALDTLQPTEVVIVGGESSVTAAVEDALAIYTDSVRRIAGDNAEETAALVSRSTVSRAEAAFIASSATFPDGLAGAAYAGKLGAPLLLVDPNVLTSGPGCEIARLGVSQVNVLGGTGAISSSVVNDIADGIDVRALGCNTGILTEIDDPRPSTTDLEVRLYEPVIGPDNEFGYVVNNAYNSILVIDLATGAHVDTIWVGSDPVDVEVSYDGDWLFAVNNGGQDVSVVDLATRTEVARPTMPITTAGTNTARSFSVAAAADGRIFVTTVGGEDSLPPMMELIQSGSSWSIVNEADGITTDAPMFRSADYQTVAVIADGGNGPRIQTYQVAKGFWETTDLAWGSSPTEAAFGTVAGPNDNYTWVVATIGGGVTHAATGDQSGTGNDYRLLGTVTSQSTDTYGLAMAPDRRAAYNVVVPSDGTPGAIEILDVNSSVDHEGNFRVADSLAMKSTVAPYDGDTRMINQVVISPDGTILLVATEHAIEVFHLIG